VRLLSSILRVAESLDRSHAQVISGLELRDRGEDMLLELHTTNDAELELWAALRHAKPFEDLVRKPVHLEVAADHKAAAVEAPTRPAAAARNGPAPARSKAPAARTRARREAPALRRA
jgi:hypothetical protein